MYIINFSKKNNVVFCKNQQTNQVKGTVPRQIPPLSTEVKLFVSIIASPENCCISFSLDLEGLFEKI